MDDSLIPNAAEGPDYKYWAFISYSHTDSDWARWLHRSLETYRVPHRLVGRPTPVGDVPRRLFPIFRDREELPSSPELSASVNEALERSRYLIVICSPNAARSRWVEEEIRYFQSLGRRPRILALIVSGEPNATDPERQCLPRALRFVDGRSEQLADLIAADARKRGDGPHQAKLKLLAGLLGVGLDELRRRDRQRQRITRLIWGVGITAALIAVAGLLVTQREQYLAREHRAYIDSLVEHGRQELVAGNAMRAAVFFNAVYSEGIYDTPLRLMLRQAMQPVDALERVIDNGTLVLAMALSPDEKRVLLVGLNGGARLWSLESGASNSEPLAHFELFEAQRLDFASGPIFSPDGQQVALLIRYRGEDRAWLSVWDAASGALRLRIPSSLQAPRLAQPFSADWGSVAVVAPDGAVELWNLDGRRLRTLPGEHDITSVSFDAPGTRLALGDAHGAVRVLAGVGLKPSIDLPNLGQPVEGVEFDATGSALIGVGVKGALRSWRLSDGHITLAGGHPAEMRMQKLSLDGQRVLTQGSDGLRVWDTVNGALLYASNSADRPALLSSLRGDGRQLAQIDDQRAAVIDVDSSKTLYTLDAAGRALQFMPNNGRLMTADRAGHLAIWRNDFRPLARRLTPPAQTPPPEWWEPDTLVVFGAGQGDAPGWLVSAGRDGAVQRLAPDTLAPQATLGQLASAVSALQVSDDGRWWAAGSVSGEIQLWDARAAELPPQRFNLPGVLISRLRLSADGSYLFAASRENESWLWRRDTGALLQHLQLDSRRAADLSPDGTQLAFAERGQVQLLNLATQHRRPLTTLGDEAPTVGCLRFSPDGKRLFALADDGSGQALEMEPASGHKKQIKLEGEESCMDVQYNRAGDRILIQRYGPMADLWTPATGAHLRTGRHAGPVLKAVWSPEDRFIVTGGSDGWAKLWDASTGDLLQNIALHAGEVSSLAYSADGDRLYTGGNDGYVQAWDVALETRPSAELSARLRCVVPWRLDRLQLQAVQNTPSECMTATPKP